MSLIVISHPKLEDRRAVVAEEALPEFADLGWVLVGPTSDPDREGLLTDEEADPHSKSGKKAKATVSPAAEPTTEAVPADDTKEQ